MPENATLEQALTAFYEMSLIPSGGDDEFFSETGEFSGAFYVDMVRQYQSEDDEYMQLTMEICFKHDDGEEVPDDFNDVWCDTPDEFTEKFRQSEFYGFIEENNSQIKEIVVFLDET